MTLPVGLTANSLQSLPEQELQAVMDQIASLPTAEQAALAYNWRFWGREEQFAPDEAQGGGPWSVWFYLGGRGTGKTRAGAEWVRETKEWAPRIALIAPTAADVRDVMLEGESGILKTSPPWDLPVYEPSKRRLTWDNGATATCFSAEDPESLRGPQFYAAWCDEVAAWKYMDATWDMLQFGMRLGDNPQALITTTPKPYDLIRRLLADPTTAVTRGSTYANRMNLSPRFFAQIIKQYEGTGLGRQELNAEVLDDVEGALWTLALIDKSRIGAPYMPLSVPDLQNITVAVDPSGAEKPEDQRSDEIGIVVAGMDAAGDYYVLEDATLIGSPSQWARMALQMYDKWSADKIVAEVNYGGEMVRHTIQTYRQSVHVEKVTASRGKHIRAQPIAGLYEQGRVHHAGTFERMEDQMVRTTAAGYTGTKSPGRLDALVWALTDLDDTDRITIHGVV